jgi:Protein of unknown function (DUF4089)
MASDFNFEAYVDHTAAAIGLPIDSAHRPNVVSYVRMIAGIAALVNEFPLPPSVELACTFTPCSTSTPE